MPKITDVPLSLFSGTNTELTPVDLPEGVSPDNQDVRFLPGSVLSRECLHKALAVALANSPTVLWLKTFDQPDGTPLTVILDSNGILWQENVTTGVVSQFGSVVPGVFGFSCTASGAEYFAFHDGFHGVDVPRQLNNGFFDRISQDGPGAPPAIADLNSTVTITSVTLAASVAISAVASAASGSINIATFTTTVAHGLVVGESILVQGVTPNNYNGVFAVVSVADATHFTITYAGSILGPGTIFGTVGPATATVVTAAPHGMVAGDAFTFTGNGGTLNTSAPGNPSNWVVQSVTNATTFVFALQNSFGILQGGQASTTGGAGGTLTIGGMISIGTHQLVVMFLTRTGFITKPSPATSWNCLGNKQAQATNIPIGPANVVARILALTGAGGGNFFYVPEDVPSGARTMIIPDNTTTSAIVDFADNTLFNATAIDIPGNNLFALVTLAPVLGFFFYASRLWTWGEWNNEKKFLNMGFEGGIVSGSPNSPLGWTVDTAGGVLTTVGVDYGVAWKITGDGTANPKGRITQNAFETYLNVPILLPNTQYTFRCWAKASAIGLGGNLICDIFSATSGVIATATIAINTVSTAGGFVQANFNALTPASIPSDAVLRIYETSLDNLATITIDENMLVFTAQPFRDTLFRASYVDSFESFDGDTGNLGSTEDPNPIMCAGSLRGTMYFQTTERLHETKDNGLTEPGQAGGGWPVDEVARVGAMSVFAMTPVAKGEEWFFTVSNGASGVGLYIFDGSGPHKISQEYQQYFDSINNAAKQNVWLVNDPKKRRVYIGTPQGSSAMPNLLLQMDYRLLDQEGQIAGSPPIHISFTGKMIASDLVRKWTRWNLTLNCGSLIARSGNTVEFAVGAGNGFAPGGASGFGNFYTLDASKLTDDDYGAMSPYYVTSPFSDDEQEQAMQLSSHRKIADRLCYRAVGVGNMIVTPYVNNLNNAKPSIRAAQLTSESNFDIERRLDVSGERIFLKFAVTPLTGQTDVKFDLSKAILTIREHPYSPVAGPR